MYLRNYHEGFHLYPNETPTYTCTPPFDSEPLHTIYFQSIIKQKKILDFQKYHVQLYVIPHLYEVVS